MIASASLLLCFLGCLPVNDEARSINGQAADDSHRIESAMRAGVRWLLRRRAPTGEIAASRSPGPSSLLSTSVALWALARSKAPEVGRQDAYRMAAFLFRHRRENGGIHEEGAEPMRAVYESEAARAALVALNRRFPSAQIERFLEPLTAFLGEARAGEGPSGPTLDERIAELGLDSGELGPDERAAVDFLRTSDVAGGSGGSWRSRRSGEQLEASARNAWLPFVFSELRPEMPAVQAALAVVREIGYRDGPPPVHHFFAEARFTLDEPHPAYRWAALARLLRLGDEGALRTELRELVGEIVAAQADDGSWSAGTARWQGDPVLTTSYAIAALVSSSGR